MSGVRWKDVITNKVGTLTKHAYIGLYSEKESAGSGSKRYTRKFRDRVKDQLD